jgi:polar amino acid transport system substrate-binding protein
MVLKGRPPGKKAFRKSTASFERHHAKARKKLPTGPYQLIVLTPYNGSEGVASRILPMRSFRKTSLILLGGVNMKTHFLRLFFPFPILVLSLFIPWQALNAKNLKIGFGAHRPPFLIVTDVPAPTGIEMEIISQVFKKINCTITPSFGVRSRMIEGMKNKNYDCIAQVKEALLQGMPVNFSKPYIVYHNSAITLAGNKIVINNLEDLIDKNVSAFQNASTVLGEEFAKITKKATSYQEMPDQTSQNKLLYSKRVDVSIGDPLIFLGINEKLGKDFDISQKIEFNPIFPEVQFKLACYDSSLRDEFDKALDALKANGEYAAIIARYQKPWKKSLK